MANKQEKGILFETKHPPYTASLKRIIIASVCINLFFLILFKWSWVRVLDIFILVALMDFVTFYFPAVTKRYIITKDSLSRKGWFGSKEVPFKQIGNISAARSSILVLSTNGKVLFKIYEIFLDKSVREKFKDILFDRFEKLCN
ncbi:MAG: hypothetical protein WA125_03600 [Desulfosporosinus sp.]